MPRRSQKKAAARAASVPHDVATFIRFLNDAAEHDQRERAYWLEYFRTAAMARTLSARYQRAIDVALQNAAVPFLDTEHPFARQTLAQSLTALGRLVDEQDTTTRVYPGRTFDHRRREAAIWLVMNGRSQDLRECSACGAWFLAEHDATRQCTPRCIQDEKNRKMREYRATLKKMSGRA
jgi:ribosomal protein S27AE